MSKIENNGEVLDENLEFLDDIDEIINLKENYLNSNSNSSTNSANKSNTLENNKTKNIRQSELKNDEYNYDIDAFEGKRIKQFQAVIAREEAKFMAFLNIEFNILNKKMVTCFRNCYSDYLNTSHKEAKECFSNCRTKVQNIFNLTKEKQLTISSRVETCLQESKNMKFANDSTSAFISCYENVIQDITKCKEELKLRYEGVYKY